MTRNIRNRVEVAVPIEDPDVKKYVLDFCDTMFADDVKIRKLYATGEYLRVENKNNYNAQEELMKKAISDFEQVETKYRENDLGNNHKILKADAAKKDEEKASFIDWLKNIFKN